MENKTLTVLLVEDNVAEATLLQELLLMEDSDAFTFSHVASLSEALTVLNKQHFDVVLLDLLLPDSWGLVTFRELHRSAPEELPIIVLSGMDDEELAVAAVREGAQDYLVKKRVDGETLKRAIRYAIERKQIEETLRRRTSELKLRNEELDAFAHTVAHDLRSPLSLILNFGELLLEDREKIIDPELVRYVELMMQYGDKMSDIIDELLLLSSVRRSEVETHPLAMDEIVTDVLKRVAHLIDQTDAQITRPHGWPTALGYAPWIEEVWFNYLSNALLYGGTPPEITLGSTVECEGRIRFWITDAGPGIPPEKQQALFRPFTQLSQAKTGGHGLGLSIVRRIIDKLGGEVGVESAVDRGSTFYFILPSTES
jgi:signal transduction histidine kinase